MSDGEALLAAIAKHPEEDVPKLAFADWLDEHGRSEQAARIRLEAELRRLPPRLPVLMPIELEVYRPFEPECRRPRETPEIAYPELRIVCLESTVPSGMCKGRRIEVAGSWPIPRPAFGIIIDRRIHAPRPGAESWEDLNIEFMIIACDPTSDELRVRDLADRSRELTRLHPGNPLHYPQF